MSHHTSNHSVVVVSHNRFIAGLQKLMVKLYKFWNYRQCDHCDRSENKTYMNHDLFVRGWECSDCASLRKQRYEKYEREQRIRKHMRDLQELEEAKLRFEAKNGVYRG